MKNHAQNNSYKSKKVEINTINRKRGSSSQVDSLFENKKKINDSPTKNDKKDNKKDKIPTPQQGSNSKENNYKISINSIVKTGINLQNNNYISKKNEDIKDKQDKKKSFDNRETSSKNKNLNNININTKENNNINLKKGNKINEINTINNASKEKDKEKEKDKDKKNNIIDTTNLPTSNIDENFYNQLKENDKKLRDNLQAYNNINKKSDGASINTLLKVRSILINWLKDSDQNLEYSKFITEKKLRYLKKNREKSEARIKILDSELNALNTRKEELEKILGEIYCYYDEEGLKEDIKRFENSNEVKSGKFSKTLEQLETMKKMLPYVTEYGKIKDNRTKKYNEKKELEKIVKSSGQTLVFLNNYYNNIKKKMEQINNNN